MECLIYFTPEETQQLYAAAMRCQEPVEAVAAVALRKKGVRVAEIAVDKGPRLAVQYVMGGRGG